MNTDGGCLANGEPVGASGLRQVYEVVTQLRGEAGERQVPGEPTVGFTQVYGAPGRQRVHGRVALMQLSLNDAELRVRDEMRAFLAEHLPSPDEIPADFDERVKFLRAWQRKLYEARGSSISPGRLSTEAAARR